MQQISIFEVSKNLPGLIEAVINGKEIIITKDDQPVVKLVPFKRGRRAGSAKGLVTISDDFDEPLEDFKDYM
jgi:antitoxin (DNA-binding transcriptional repressor) of toxin-antitoxin stability system